MKNISESTTSGMSSQFTYSLSVILLSLSLLNGCDMNDSMIKEMETAYAIALQERSNADRERINARVEAIKREREKSPAPLIKGLDYAAIARVEAEKEEEKEAISRAVQKYFPIGMKVEEAFKRLRQMKEDGFETSEWRHEGARNWPDGEFKPYLDEQTKRNLQQQYPIGVSEFIAKKQYGFHISLLATKHIAITFRVVDGSAVISKVKGDIRASGV